MLIALVLFGQTELAKIKYSLCSCLAITIKDKIVANKSFKTVTKLKYLGKVV
jgi:hypothetical protein